MVSYQFSGKRTQKAVIDHEGNEFDSIVSMLNHYGVSKNTFYARKRKGLSLKECLTQ